MSKKDGELITSETPIKNITQLEHYRLKKQKMLDGLLKRQEDDTQKKL